MITDLKTAYVGLFYNFIINDFLRVYHNHWKDMLTSNNNMADF